MTIKNGKELLLKITFSHCIFVTKIIKVPGTSCKSSEFVFLRNPLINIFSNKTQFELLLCVISDRGVYVMASNWAYTSELLTKK